MADTRKFPVINYVATDTETLVNALVRAYELITGRKLYPADPARLFILWAADFVIQERVLFDQQARQNVPRWAKGEYLDSLADLFKDVERLQAKPAKTTFRFHLSAAQAEQQTIPQGTRVTVDGEITFATTAPLFIEAGELSGDVAAECLTAGEIGNGFLPGQITQLVDVFAFYERVENITESAGGSEVESDESFYQRMRENVETFSTAGPLGAYKYHAKSASPLVADVAADSPEEEPGVVDVRILLQDGELPTEEVLTLVKSALSDDKVRPLTDFVRVTAPDTVQFDIDLTYYIPNPSAASASIIALDVENAVQEYVRWQTEKMGRDVNPSRLVSLLMETGIKRVDVRKPQFLQVGTKAVAVLGTRTVENGGVEDE